MKKRVQLVFLLFVVTAFLANPLLVSAADSKKKGMDTFEELSDKTFFVVEHAWENKPQHDYHAYFKKDGVLAIKFSPKHSKSGKWHVDGKGNLCITTTRHKDKTSLQETKCGKLVKSSKTVYRWYDGKARHRATFSLKGEGDRLP